MATLAPPQQPQPQSRPGASSDDGFFMTMAIVIAATIVIGFGQFAARGLSSFGAPAIVHAHAIIFMGWVVIYLAQNRFATRGPIALHRRLGWLACGWLVLMLVVGTAVTARMVRLGTVPIVFQPLHFLVFDPLSLLTAMALVGAAIALRRRTDWHRRLQLCAMAVLTGPAFGRLLPMPLLIPWAYHAAFAATLIWPVIGMVRDWRTEGRVHPAYGWGLGGMMAMEVVIDAVAFGPLGLALYQAVTAGSPGAAVPPLAFPPFPAG